MAGILFLRRYERSGLAVDGWEVESIAHTKDAALALIDDTKATSERGYITIEYSGITRDAKDPAVRTLVRGQVSTS